MRTLILFVPGLLLLAGSAAAQDRPRDIYCEGTGCRELSLDGVGVLAQRGSDPASWRVYGPYGDADRHRHSLPEQVGYWVLGGLHLADGTYSMYLIGKDQGREVGPVLRYFTNHPGRFAAVKWAGAGVGFWGTWWLFEHSHPRLAWASLASQVVGVVCVVYHNHRVFELCCAAR